MATIIIVEDEAALNELLCRDLRLVGHTCVPAFDGKAALEELQRQPCDQMLLDILLPELDGFSVYERAQGVPTIFLTAKGGLADRVKGLMMGADV